MNGWWRRWVKDRQSVRGICRLVLVSCALGLLVCTALAPGYSEDMHEMMEAADGKDHVRGSASSSARKNGAPVWMGKKSGMGLNVRNDNSRGDLGAYDQIEGSFERDLSDYKNNNSSKSHRRERNDNHIQRSIHKKDEGNSSTSKDSKIGVERNSHEKHEMSSVRHLGKNRNSYGHNNHDGHGERNNSHKNRVESNNHRRNSFQRDSGRESSRIWRFMANGDQPSLGHRSHGNSSHVSGHKNSSRGGDSPRGDSYVSSTDNEDDSSD